MENQTLVNTTKIRVRFSDVDSMGIVWHGNYIRYFEDAREDFGKKYGINYLDFYHQQVLIPVVKVVCDYKKPLFYGDIALVEARFINCDAAKIQYDYTIYRESTRDVIATGMSLQVFVNRDRELLLENPAFFQDWKYKFGLE